MNAINEYFDKIFCINLDRRPDRKKKASDQFEKLELNVEFFSAIDKLQIQNPSRIPDGPFACACSHYNVIQKAKKNNYKNILIFEDDVILADNFLDIFDQNISSIPKDCKMLYFGGNHLNGKVKITDNIYRMVSSLTTHAYSINSDMYDIILQKLEYVYHPVDVSYAHLHLHYPAYVMQDGEKSLAWQDIGYSDIDDSECDYTWLK
jgi:glycosyl transferase family 25